jgi:hypothetical protein
LTFIALLIGELRFALQGCPIFYCLGNFIFQTRTKKVGSIDFPNRQAEWCVHVCCCVCAFTQGFYGFEVWDSVIVTLTYSPRRSLGKKKADGAASAAASGSFSGSAGSSASATETKGSAPRVPSDSPTESKAEKEVLAHRAKRSVFALRPHHCGLLGDFRCVSVRRRSCR